MSRADVSSRSVVVLTAVLAACGGAKAPRSTPRVRPPPIVLAPHEEVEAPRSVPLEVAPVDPKAEELLRARVSEPAIPLTEGEAPRVTLDALDATARGEARGAKPDGAPRVVKLVEGQRAALPLAMEAGDCVTVIVHGGLGVMEVDAFLVAPKTPGAALVPDFTILAEDTRTGPLAILGGQRGCYLASSTTPGGLELWIQARKGTGPVVVGLYRVPRPG